jgi:UrcA family protein
MKPLSFSLFLVSSLTVIATPASAGASKDAKAVKFAYQAHELATNQGRAAMLGRMKATAIAACRWHTSAFHPTARQCRTDLETQFLSAIGNNALTAQYKGDAVEVASNGS